MHDPIIAPETQTTPVNYVPSCWIVPEFGGTWRMVESTTPPPRKTVYDLGPQELNRHQRRRFAALRRKGLA